MPEEKDALGFTVVGSTQSSEPEQSSAPAQKDPLGFDIVGGGSSSPTPSIPSQAPESEPTPTAPAVDPLGFTVVGGSSSAPKAAPTTDSGEDPNAPWYKKVWGVLNKPLVDIDSVLGRTDKAGGFEKGVNDLVSGLTSPLSLAIAVGTLGSGSLIEAGGATALRGAGMAASEIGEVTKGAQILADTLKTGRTVQEGMEAAQAAGVNPDVLNKGLQALKDASLDSGSLLSKGIIRNAGTKVASSLGLAAKDADTVGQGLQFLTSAGFTAQQAIQATQLSPRVLDALRAGDYQEAERLGVDALGSAVLGGLGAHAVAKESGAFMNDIAAKAGLKVKPSEENLTVRNNFGEYDKNVATAGRSAELWAQDLRKQYGDLDPTQLERIRYYVEAGNDPSVMAKRFNTVAAAADRDVRLPIDENPETGQTPVTSGLSPDRLNEVVAEKNIAAKYKSQEIDKLLDAYDPTKLTDADKELADQISNKFKDTLEYAQKNDALKDGVQDYVTNLWEKEEGNNEAANKLKHDASTGQFNTDTSMARSRIFSNSLEGQLFGKKLAETDPITLAAHNSSTFNRVVEARKAIERLADNGTKASDGRPLVALSGTHSISTDGDPASFINPNGVRSIKIADNVVQGLKDSGDLDKMIQEGKVTDITRRLTPEDLPAEIDRLESKAISANPKFDEEGNDILRKNIQTLKGVRDGKLPTSSLDDINAQQPKTYAWNPKDYAQIDHPSLQAWNHLGQSPSGDSVLMRSDMLVHPEIKDYLERRLGVDSQGPLDNPIGRGLAKVGSEAKGLTLSLSPFHIVQIGLRGVMSGVSPFKIERWDLANDPVLAKGVEQGLTLKTNYANRSAFSDGTMQGHSAVLDKIPGVGTIQRSLNSFLFDKYLPAVKSSAYKALVERYQEHYPSWTPEKAAEVAAEDTNNRFGGLNYKRLGRAASTQNWLKLASLAPDFLEGEIKSIFKPFSNGEGAISRQDYARMVAYMWMSARVLNMITSQKMHLEAPFGVAVKTDSGKESVISIRSLPGDLMHAASDPVGFIRNRMSPIVRTGAELYSGTNSFGQKLDQPSLMGDIVRNNLPIPIQSVGKAISGTGPETGNTGQVIGALGGTDTIYRTEAQKLASKVASNHMESGPVDPAALQRHQLTMQLEDSLRAGKIAPSDVSQLVIAGQMPQSDAKRMLSNYQKTKDMTPDIAALYTRASRLPTKDILQVYEMGTQPEKEALAPLVQKSAAAYVKNSLAKMTPQERLADPTLRKVMTMMPNTTLF